MIVKNVNMIVDMLWKSGVQIIVFLAGLQSIPTSFYEVCDIEGATSWQKFWRVTFPVMMPFVFLNIIYTIIDSFTYYSNPIMEQILTYFNNLQYSLQCFGVCIFHCNYSNYGNYSKALVGSHCIYRKVRRVILWIGLSGQRF